MRLQLTLHLPIDAQYLRVVRSSLAAFLERIDVPQYEIDEVQLIVGELATNAVRHSWGAEAPEFTVDLEYESGCIIITVTDGGRGFDRSKIPPPDLDQIGGWGLWLVERFAHNVEFLPVVGGARVKATIRLSQSAGIEWDDSPVNGIDSDDACAEADALCR